MWANKLQYLFTEKNKYSVLIYFFFSNSNSVVTSVNYVLKLTSDAPAIRGSLITFSADLLDDNGSHVVVTDTLKWVKIIMGFCGQCVCFNLLYVSQPFRTGQLTSMKNR